MKYIQLKDQSGVELYPYTTWSIINDKPAIFEFTSASRLVNELLKSVSGYNVSKLQVLKNDHGTFKWVDE